MNKKRKKKKRSERGRATKVTFLVFVVASSSSWSHTCHLSSLYSCCLEKQKLVRRISLWWMDVGPRYARVSSFTAHAQLAKHARRALKRPAPLFKYSKKLFALFYITAYQINPFLFSFFFSLLQISEILASFFLLHLSNYSNIFFICLLQFV